MAAIDPIDIQYGEDMPEALPGMIADSGNGDDRSSVNTESTAEIPQGAIVAMVAGSDTDVVLPASSGAVMGGVAIRSGEHLPGTHLGTTGLKPKVSFARRSVGRIWGICEEAMTTTDSVYVRIAANGAGKLQLGAVRNDADTVSSVDKAVVTTKVKVVKATTGAGPILLDCNFRT